MPAPNSSDRIRLDDERFRQTWLDFVRHPASARVREELGTSFGVCFLGWFILLLAGLIMLVTIRWTIDGLKCLWSVIKFEPFQAMGDNPSNKPDDYQPILAHGIIIGPDRVHALVLSTFRRAGEYSVDQVAQVATELGRLYSEGSDDPADAATYALLKDDMFRPYRRRKLPDDHPAAALDLVLLDAELDLNETRQSPLGTLITAMVVKKGDSGPTTQLPWPVAESAVRMD